VDEVVEKVGLEARGFEVIDVEELDPFGSPLGSLSGCPEKPTDAS